jgi:hypothetical protein
MARTGYKITVYLDDNPLSPTYMHTYEERTLDETACPIPTDDLVLVSNECEIDLTGYTGYRLEIYYNRTTGEYTEQRVLDPECRESSTEEQWVNSGSPYCETNESGINTGYMLQLQVQMNPNLANYGETRTQRYKSPECGGNDCAIWEEVSRQCHVAVYDCVATFDGTADVVQIDISPLSPTYNQTRQINVESTATCDNCTSTTFKWVDMGDVCGDDSLICTNGLTENIKSTNKYNIKRRYKTVSGTDIPMDEYQITLVEEDSEDCGFIRPQYRWDVVVGQYLCDYETYTKYQMLVKMVSYDGGTTWATKQPLETQRGEVLAYDSYDCGKPMYRWIETGEFVCTNYNPPVATLYLTDGSSVEVVELASASLKQYSATTSSITVNSECKEISDGAFQDFTALESITMSDNIPITIGSLMTRKLDVLKIYVPDDAYGEYMEQWSEYTEHILPMSVEEHYTDDGLYTDLFYGNIIDRKVGTFYYLNSQLLDKKIYKDTVVGSAQVQVNNSQGLQASSNYSNNHFNLIATAPKRSSSLAGALTIYYTSIPSAKTSANIAFTMICNNYYNNEERPTLTLTFNGVSYTHTYTYADTGESYDITYEIQTSGRYKKIYIDYSATNFIIGKSQSTIAAFERYIELI